MAPTFKSWACAYVHQGETFVFEIKARSLTEAEAHMKSIRRTAICVGEITATGQGAFHAEETMQ